MTRITVSRTVRTLLIVAATVAASGLAAAAPPSTSPYITDAQSSYVQDATSQSIGQVNMITCVVHAMRPDALVNQGPYIALVDKNACDALKSSAADSGASASAAQAPDYMNVIVDSTRVSNTDPMIVKAWISLNENGQPITIFAHASATAAPSATDPYGAFRLDYCGKTAGTTGCLMNGYIEAGSGALSYYESDTSPNGSQTTALKLSSVGTTSGSGSLSEQQSGNGGSMSTAFDFAYDQNYFLRSDPSSTSECFSRDATDPATGFSVWQYGLYDSTTGVRINRNSGFPIEFTTGGTTYQGYLGYYGLSLPPAAASALTTGSTVDKVDYQSGSAPLKTPYNVVTNGGRLMRYTKETRTLKQIDQIHFNAWVGSTAGTSLPQPNTQYEMYWDDASGLFVVTGMMQCGQNGCQTSNLAPSQTLSASFWASNGSGGVQGWSQSLGGDLFIDLSQVTGTVDSSSSGSITVVYHVQDIVYPDDPNKPATLYCVNNCPTGASLQSYFTQATPGSVASPYAGSSNNNFQPTQAANVLSYTVDANAVLNDGTAAVVYTDANAYQQYPQYQDGVMSGRLFANLTDAQCNSGQYCDWAVNNATQYYVWQTGPNSWDQFTGVQDSTGAFVHFDSPLQVSFQVPSNVSGTAPYGSYAGTSLVLQYAGFGQLWGIPGSCVSEITNQPADCTAQGSRYVPEFMIPYDPTANPQQGVVTATANGVTSTYLVKWLQREIRFAPKAASVCANDNLQLPTGVQLPTAAGLADPSDSSSPVYLGTEPAVTSAARVIQGTVEY